MPRLGVCVPSVCSGSMVEKSLNNILKSALAALNVTSGSTGFTYTVGANEYLKDDNTEYTGGDIAAL
jgi:hypothetical protein